MTLNELRELILKSPDSRPGSVINVENSEFTPISTRNYGDYTVIGRVEGLTYFIHPGGLFGFVAYDEDLNSGKHQIISVMRLKLTPFNVGGSELMRVTWVRIRASCARDEIVIKWYEKYVITIGAIVSDCAPPESGKLLWRSLIKMVDSSPDLLISLHSVLTGENIADISQATPESEIWPGDDSNENKVLILSKR